MLTVVLQCPTLGASTVTVGCYERAASTGNIGVNWQHCVMQPAISRVPGKQRTLIKRLYRAAVAYITSEPSN